MNLRLELRKIKIRYKEKKFLKKNLELFRNNIIIDKILTENYINFKFNTNGIISNYLNLEAQKTHITSNYWDLEERVNNYIAENHEFVDTLSLDSQFLDSINNSYSREVINPTLESNILKSILKEYFDIFSSKELQNS